LRLRKFTVGIEGAREWVTLERHTILHDAGHGVEESLDAMLFLKPVLALFRSSAVIASPMR